MEEKPSFYDLIAAHSKSTPKEEKKTQKIYLIISWLIFFLGNSIIVWLGWNFVISKVFSLASLTLVQSVLLYSFCKVVLRGFFSAQ